MGSDQSVATNSDIVGYQVVRVSPDSPAAKTGLCPYFDFIISLDDISIQNEEHTFVQEYITKSVNQPLKMQIFSTKTMTFRGTSHCILTDIC
jgi:C-terminal processing protease CtpA/Prc